MAFGSYEDENQPREWLDQALDKAAKVAEIAKSRDEIFATNEDKPMKLIFMAAGIGWAIYHFLIKR